MPDTSYDSLFGQCTILTTVKARLFSKRNSLRNSFLYSRFDRQYTHGLTHELDNANRIQANRTLIPDVIPNVLSTSMLCAGSQLIVNSKAIKAHMRTSLACAIPRWVPLIAGDFFNRSQMCVKVTHVTIVGTKKVNTTFVIISPFSVSACSLICLHLPPRGFL